MLSSLSLDVHRAMDWKPTFFDSIDDETKAHIVTWATRICSFRADIHPHPFGLFFDRDCPFFSAIRHVFNKLTVNVHMGSALSAFFKKPERSECDVSPSFAREYNVVRCLGPSLKNIVLGDVSKPSDALLLDVLEYCKDLKSLKFGVNNSSVDDLRTTANLVQRLLSKNAHSIEDLGIAHGPGNASWVVLFRDELPLLKSLSLVGRASWVHTWCTLLGTSDNLTKLCLFTEKDVAPNDWEALFKAIRQKWPKLSDVQIHGGGVPQVEYETFLVSCGHQLRHVVLRTGVATHSDDDDDTPSVEFANRMGRIASHCPNLEIDANFGTDVYFDDVNADHLPRHLAEMAVAFPGDESNWEELERFANGLKKLKVFACFGLPRVAYHAFFATSKPALKKLGLYQTPPDLDINIVGKMKNSVPNLRDFSVDIFNGEAVDVWCSFLKGCTDLERVQLKCDWPDRFFTGSDVVADICNRFLSALRECEKLQFIGIDLSRDVPVEERKEFKNQVKSAQFFRFRPVRIQMCGIDMFFRAMPIFECCLQTIVRIMEVRGEGGSLQAFGDATSFADSVLVPKTSISKRHASFDDVICGFPFVGKLLVELGTFALSQLAMDEVERCEYDNDCVV